MKRQRGRGRKPGGGHHHNIQGGQHPNRQLESNGPEAKVRGPASHIHERYLQLARDAAGSGDRVLSENYLQHADHYFRLWRSMQPAIPIQPQPNSNEGVDYEGAEETASADSEDSGDVEGRPDGDEQPEVAYRETDDRARDGERDDGGRRRRGRNRNRFRAEGEREGSYESREGEDRRERGEGEREPRRERPAREDREAGSREGFSDGPKPAFLRGGSE
jgi:hypothetical protein